MGNYILDYREGIRYNGFVVRSHNPMTKEQVASGRLYAAAEELLLNAKMAGGGDLYIEEYGRLCFCPCPVKHLQDARFHSTACNDLNASIAKAEGR